MAYKKFNRYKSKRRAKGFISRNSLYRIQVTVAFDEEMFNKMVDKSVKENISLSRVIREFCEWGLEESFI